MQKHIHAFYVKRIFLLTVIICIVIFLNTYIIIPYFLSKNTENRNFCHDFLSLSSNLLKDQKHNIKPINSTNPKFTNDLPWWDDDSLEQCSKIFDPEIEKLNTLNYEDIISIYWKVSNQSSLMQSFIWREAPVNMSAKLNHCGHRSHLRGSEQKVISYSVYGSNPGYMKGLTEIIEAAKILYPDYIIRFHLNPRGTHYFLCPILLKYRQKVDVCDVLSLPHPLGDVSGRNPMIWRAAPYGDPAVKRFIVRDSDSTLTVRELSAVQQWEESGKLLHIMRDNPNHDAAVLGGMFGVYQPPDTVEVFEKIRRKLFASGRETDQDDYSVNINEGNDVKIIPVMKSR